MGLEKYVASHETESAAWYCACAYARHKLKPAMIMDIVDHLDMDAETAQLVVEALDAMEDLRR